MAVLSLFVLPVHAQPFPDSQEMIEADPNDVSSIAAIVEASYDVISGIASEQRDWDRERSLFHPDSRHMPTQPNEQGGHRLMASDVEGFIERADAYFQKNDFFEYEIARKVEQFGNIAHVFSTYAWSNEKGGPVGGRGINSFQLLYDGQRWWIVSIFWQQESEDYPIPEQYLPVSEQH